MATRGAKRELRACNTRQHWYQNELRETPSPQKHISATGRAGVCPRAQQRGQHLCRSCLSSAGASRAVGDQSFATEEQGKQPSIKPLRRQYRGAAVPCPCPHRGCAESRARRSADVGAGERGQGCLTRRNGRGEGVCFCSSWMCLGEGWERLLSLAGRGGGWQGRDKAPDKFGLAAELIS